MKYLFWAAFLLLLDASISQDLDVPCRITQDCQTLSNAPPQVQCVDSYCKCIDDKGIPQNCALVNVNSTEAHLDAGGLIGRICSLDKDCNVPDINAVCNTTRKQCACNTGYVASLDNQKCLPAIQYNNSGCEIAKQCLYSVGNSTCSNGVCLCDVNYHYTSGACWAMKEFGFNCSATEECTHVKDAICNDQYRCSCPTNRVINPAITACFPIASKIEDECVESIQCTEFLGEKSACVDNRCRCHEHYHQSADTAKCTANLHIGAACQFDNECSNGETTNGAFRCLENKCACGANFENINGKCQPKEQLVGKSAGSRLSDVSAFVISLAYLIILLSSV